MCCETPSRRPPPILRHQRRVLCLLSLFRAVPRINYLFLMKSKLSSLHPLRTYKNRRKKRALNKLYDIGVVGGGGGWTGVKRKSFFQRAAALMFRSGRMQEESNRNRIQFAASLWIIPIDDEKAECQSFSHYPKK